MPLLHLVAFAGKATTADRIVNHGGHANSVCTLCRTNTETHLHMVAKCSYAKAVWQKIAFEFNIQPPIQHPRTLCRWWHSVLRQSAADRDKHLQATQCGTSGRNDVARPSKTSLLMLTT
jgi:hypothetical protein